MQVGPNIYPIDSQKFKNNIGLINCKDFYNDKHWYYNKAVQYTLIPLKIQFQLTLILAMISGKD